MSISRREFLFKIGVTAFAGTLLARCNAESEDVPPDPDAPLPPEPDYSDWNNVIKQFNLSPEFIHMSALYISSHPKIVRDAIEEYRKNLDEQPAVYLDRQNRARRRQVREAAAGYLSVSRDEIALTDSTTMGLGMVYNGFQFNPDDQILTTENDYFVTHESLRTTSERTGAAVEKVPIYEDIKTISVDEIISNIKNAITDRTRLVAVTWVHSGTGLKLPLPGISRVIRDANKDRDETDRIILSVDGVHGFGIEDIMMDDLGCDFFIAGCHKWLFGPRGTGIIWGNKRAWAKVIPTIPSFTDDEIWNAWLSEEDPDGPTTAETMTPGGFKSFEHQWAVAQAFQFHRQIGKVKISRRTHELARQLKEGLSEMSHVTLHTPLDDVLSSGIVCFDVKGRSPRDVVRYLRERRIIATSTPYSTIHARLAPSIYNSPEDIERVLQEVRTLG